MQCSCKRPLTYVVADLELQSTRKKISPGEKHIEVYQRDLLTQEQQTQFAGLPNYDANVAGVDLPFKIRLESRLGRLVGIDGFGELVILSRKR